MPSFSNGATAPMSIEPFAEHFVLPALFMQRPLEALSALLEADVDTEVLFQGVYNTVRVADEAELGLEILAYELVSQVPHLSPDAFNDLRVTLFEAGMELRDWLTHLQLYRHGVCPYVAIEPRAGGGMLLKRQDVYLRDLKHEFGLRTGTQPSA